MVTQASTKRSIGSLLLLLAACGKAPVPAPPQQPPVAAAPATPVASVPVPVPVPDTEPSEEVLRRLEFQRYEAIERAGGMPVTITATGRSLTLHPKLHEVRKESCRRSPQSPPGWYECSLTIKLSLKPDGRDPTEQGERIAVKWSPSGAWVLQ